MIEAVMLAALGFLIASFLWLIMLPAISRRAERLARRRAELTFPLSVDEIAAERDHLRAEFAVRQRELERRVEDSQEIKASALKNVGVRDMQISELKTTLGVRDISIVDLSGRLTATEADLAQTRERLALEEAGHASTRSDLAVRGQVLTERDREVSELRIERADLSATLAARVRDLEQATARGENLSGELAMTSARLAELTAQHQALEAEKDRLRIALAESETLSAGRASDITGLEHSLTMIKAALEAETAGHNTTRAAFEQRGVEVAALMAERDSLRQRLKASDDALARSEQIASEQRGAKATADAKFAALRKEADNTAALLRDTSADKARLDVALASARREHEMRIKAMLADLETAQSMLAQTRGERAALARDITDLRRETERLQVRLDAESAQLRTEITKVADQFLQAKPSLLLSLVDKAMAAPDAAAKKADKLAVTPAPAAALRPRRQAATRKPMVSAVPDRAAE